MKVRAAVGALRAATVAAVAAVAAATRKGGYQRARLPKNRKMQHIQAARRSRRQIATTIDDKDKFRIDYLRIDPYYSSEVEAAGVLFSGAAIYEIFRENL